MIIHNIFKFFFVDTFFMSDYETHIFRTLPPIRFPEKKFVHRIDYKTVNLADYCSYIKNGNIDLSEILFDGVEVVNRDGSEFDIGHSYFVVKGSLEKAQDLMKTIANNFNSYLERHSKRGKEVAFSYALVH